MVFTWNTAVLHLSRCEVAAAADACTHRVLPVVTQVTSLCPAPCTAPIEHKLPALPIEPAGQTHCKGIKEYSYFYRYFYLFTAFCSVQIFDQQTVAMQNMLLLGRTDPDKVYVIQVFRQITF